MQDARYLASVENTAEKTNPTTVLMEHTAHRQRRGAIAEPFLIGLQLETLTGAPKGKKKMQEREERGRAKPVGHSEEFWVFSYVFYQSLTLAALWKNKWVGRR